MLGSLVLVGSLREGPLANAPAAGDSAREAAVAARDVAWEDCAWEDCCRDRALEFFALIRSFFSAASFALAYRRSWSFACSAILDRGVSKARDVREVLLRLGAMLA